MVFLPECSGYWQERRQCGQYTSLMMVIKNILMIIHNIGLLDVYKRQQYDE